MTKTCIDPPPLDTAQLLAFLDGDADPSIAAHLRRCDYCRGQATRLAKLQQGLTAKLYRVSCPTSSELGEYQLGRLGAKRSAMISQHLAECPHCARELAQLVTFLGDLSADEQPGLLERAVEKIRVVVARLVSGPEGAGLSAGLAPALAGIRGDDLEPYIFAAGDAQIAITIADDDARPGQYMLIGLVTGADGGQLQAHLWRDGALITSAALDDTGNFAFSGLTPGRYELILSGPDIEIYVQELIV